jgi:hypothetical protein
VTQARLAPFRHGVRTCDTSTIVEVEVEGLYSAQGHTVFNTVIARAYLALPALVTFTRPSGVLRPMLLTGPVVDIKVRTR